jgi:hypothetical protein
VTTTAEKLAARAEDLPEGSFRRAVLEGVRRFKSAWVEFGKMLSDVRRKELWREWGHASFERYCARELFLRKATADKLTASYGFLERHEPQLARGGRGDGRAPPFEVIEVLSRAEEAGRLTAAGWRELRDEVLDRPTTPAALSRRLAERLGPEAEPEAPPRSERVRRIGSLARRLAEACRREGGIPRQIAARAEALAAEIESLPER